MKKSSLAMLLAGLSLGVGQVWADVVNCTDYPGKLCAEFDIVVRDFQVTHPDFENFQEEAYNSLTAKNNFTSWNPYIGFGTNQEWLERRSISPNGYGTHGCGNTQTPMYGIPIGTDGYPRPEQLGMLPATGEGVTSTLPPYLLAKTSSAGFVWYGEFTNCQRGPKNPDGLKVMRGFAHELCSSNTMTWAPGLDDGAKNCNLGICNTNSWSQIVYTTPGMVKPYLKFDVMGEDGQYDMYEAKIEKNRPACDNVYFDQWYTDREAEGLNKRSNMAIQLPLVDGTQNTYEIDYNWNNGGYFPLDVVDPVSKNWIGPKEMTNQFGPQTLSIFCPPYDYEWASTQTDYLGENTAPLCQAWKMAGGPRNPDAATNAALTHPAIGQRHLRNYNLTMMGYIKFKYKQGAGEVFEFAGDDDMWIFVDGVLAVDLGGTHLAAPGKADLDFLAANAHGCNEGEPLANKTGAGENCDLDLTTLPGQRIWKNDTWHHLHFFYADRQSDGSNMKLHTTISEMAKSRYGQPTVGNAVVKVDENGVVTNSLFLNTPLDPATVQNIMTQGPTVPSMVVMREVTNALGEKETVVYGYYIDAITGPTDKGSEGQLYQFSGVLRDAAGNEIQGGILGGDAVAFNVFDPEGTLNDLNNGEVWDASLSPAERQQLLAWSQKMAFPVTSASGKSVEGFDPKADWAKITYTAVAVIELIPGDPGIERPDFTTQAAILSDKASSDGLPVDMTADLVLTPIPAIPGVNPLTWASDNAAQMMVSTADGSVVTTVTDTRGVQVSLPAPSVSSALTNGSSNPGAQTLCFNDGAGKSGSSSSESCTSFAFATTQPFRVNIRVFDHLGHFVNQYNKSVTGEEFNKALGVAENIAGCTQPYYGNTGAMLSVIKMYPVTQYGRQLATGPYIYQVTIVKEAYEYCYMSNGQSPTDMKMPYQRQTETYVRGYRRSKK